jgi:transposase-like protein
MLENLVEQADRRVKRRIGPMLGFKRFDHPAVTTSGIELAEEIKKGSRAGLPLADRRIGPRRIFAEQSA